MNPWRELHSSLRHRRCRTAATKTLATISLAPKAEKIRLRIKGKIHINKKQEVGLENSDVYSNFAEITYRLCQQLFILHQYMVLSTAEGWEFL